MMKLIGYSLVGVCWMSLAFGFGFAFANPNADLVVSSFLGRSIEE